MTFDILDHYSYVFRHPLGYTNDDLILPVLGEHAVRYLLSAEDGVDTQATIKGSDAAIVKALGSLAETVIRGKKDLDSIAHQLSIFVAETGTSLGNSLRLRSGGDLPEPPSHADPLTRALLALACDEWPQLLLPPARMPWWPLPSYGARGGIDEFNPRRGEAIKGALSDPWIAEAFPISVTGPDPFTGVEVVTDAVGDWASSSGAGGTQYLSLVLGNLIAMSGFRALSLGQEHSFEHLCAQLPDAVQGFRRLAHGDEAAIPVVVGLTGLELEDASGIHFEGGTLRRVLDLERRWYFLDSEDVRSVFVFDAPAKWVKIDRPTEEPDAEQWFADFELANKKMRNFHRSSQDPVATLQAAVLLAGEDQQMQTLAEHGRLILEPSGQAPWTVANWQVHPTSHRHQRGEVRTLRENESEMTQWLGRLEPRRVGGLRLALEKATQAAVERHHPEDRLLDAIIGLEALVGGPSEMTFRVSLAVAWALAPESAEERREVQKAVRRLYGTRSALVHGSKRRPENLEDAADEALTVLLRVLRVLLRDRPELVAMTTADERSAALTLGDQTGPKPLEPRGNHDGDPQ